MEVRRLWKCDWRGLLSWIDEHICVLKKLLSTIWLSLDSSSMSRSWFVQPLVDRGSSSAFKITLCCSTFISLAFQSSHTYKYLLRTSLDPDLPDFDLDPIPLWFLSCCLHSWLGLLGQEPLALCKVINWQFHLRSRSISGELAAAHSNYVTEVGQKGAVIICKFCQQNPFHFCCFFFSLYLGKTLSCFSFVTWQMHNSNRRSFTPNPQFIIFLMLPVAFSKDSEQCAKSLLGNSHS